MAVALQSQSHRGVSQKLLHEPRMVAAREQQRRAGVPEIVKPYIPGNSARSRSGLKEVLAILYEPSGLPPWVQKTSW